MYACMHACMDNAVCMQASRHAGMQLGILACRHACQAGMQAVKLAGRHA